MTDHHTEAERLLQESGDIPASDEANYIAMAQVHATLALADAVRQKPMTVTQHIAATEGTTPEEVTERAMRRCAKDAQPQKVVQSVDADKARDVAAEIERLREEVAMTERYRDDVIQACAAAEHERDIAACRLGGIGNALGLAAVDTADLPRLVRELREERDRLQVASYGDRDDWKALAEQRLKELADLKARAVVLPDGWRADTARMVERRFGNDERGISLHKDLVSYLQDVALCVAGKPRATEPASREPEGHSSCPCAAASRRQEPCHDCTGSEDCKAPLHIEGCYSGGPYRPASREPVKDAVAEFADPEPETPGFKPGDRVWLIHKRCAATFQRYLSADGTCLVRLGDGTNYPTVTALLCHPGGDDR